MAELDGIVEQLTKQLEVAEQEALDARTDLTAARFQVDRLSKVVKVKESQVRNLANGIRVLTQTPGTRGRPIGRDPQGIAERVKTLLSDGNEWTGVTLKEALGVQGVTVEANRISSALAKLDKDGQAKRIRKGVWIGV